MKKCIFYFVPLLSAVFFGATLTLAYAPFNIFPFGIIAPAALIVLLLNVDAKMAFNRGLAFGIGNFGTGVYWIFHSVHTIGGVPSPIALLLTSGLILLLALFQALTCYFFKRYFNHQSVFSLAMAFPALWTLSDYFRTLLFTGFPWLFIGYSQINSPLRGYAALLSVYGVTLLALCSSGLLVYSWVCYKKQIYRQSYGSLLIILFIWVVGGALNLVQWTHAGNTNQRLALVQGDIPQTLKWSPEHEALSFNRYTQLTEALFGKADIIIWPEAAIPDTLQNQQYYLQSMFEKAKAANSQLILGIPVKKPDGNGYYNSVVVLGDTLQLYNKRHLVPFGEYTPNFPFLNRAMSMLNIPLSDTVSGDINQPLFNVNGIKILTTVCYEIAYPELMRSDVIDDPNLGFILTVTNDGWFGRSIAQAQHLQMAQMRALEFGRPVVFVSNDGITAIINADGNIATAAPPYQPYVLTGNITPRTGLTPFMMTYGSSIYKYLLVVFLLFSIHEAVSKRRATKKRASLEPGL